MCSKLHHSTMLLGHVLSRPPTIHPIQWDIPRPSILFSSLLFSTLLFASLLFSSLLFSSVLSSRMDTVRALRRLIRRPQLPGLSTDLMLASLHVVGITCQSCSLRPKKGGCQIHMAGPLGCQWRHQPDWNNTRMIISIAHNWQWWL